MILSRPPAPPSLSFQIALLLVVAGVINLLLSVLAWPFEKVQRACNGEIEETLRR